ncbi:MAG: WYL domain-containing transcriptional regulator [Phycisphaerales bacterium]|nr:MAG: WYL domain-containing transcriptional regulator [Phycisphaerales bacterium]
MIRKRFRRMLRILPALRSGRANIVNELAAFFNVSRRTVRRDLRQAREDCTPNYYDPNTGLCDTGQDSDIPAINLNRPEAMLLLLLAYRAADCFGAPLRDSTLRAASKVENTLSAETRQFCQAYMRTVTIKTGPHPHLDPGDRTFWRLVDAVRRQRMVNIRYRPELAQSDVLTDLSPYHLVYDERAWHVIGRSSLHNSTCTFKLSRIKELGVLSKFFAGAEDFDVNEYLGKAWSMVPEGKLYDVKLRFLPEVAPDVSEIQWHGTQRVSFDADGSAILEFCVDGLSEITWWIMSYGDKVQVLGPKVLCQRIIEIARNMISGESMPF